MELDQSTRPAARSQKKRWRVLVRGGALVLALGILAAAAIGMRESVVPEEVVHQPIATSTSAVVSDAPTTVSELIDEVIHSPVIPHDDPVPLGLSVAETLTGLTPDELDRQLDDFVTLNIEWIRLDFDWAVIQRKDAHTYDWERVDRVVAAAHKRNLKLLPILVYTPRWAQPDDCQSVRCPPREMSMFGDFAEAAASRYASKGIHTWEIWNEPNTSLSWRPGADASAYTALLKEAHERIKTVDPDAFIVSGGLAVIGTENGSIAPREYLSQMYAAGAGSYFDAFAFHPYSFPALPSHRAQWNGWQQMSFTSPSLRSIMRDNGDAHKKIWITEYGAPTGGPGSAAEAYIPLMRASHVTEAYQKQMLIDALEELKSASWAGPFFWYSYQDIGTAPDTPENFYGLLRFDGSPKPGYEALKHRSER